MIWYTGNFIKSYVNPKLRNLVAKSRRTDLLKSTECSWRKRNHCSVISM